MMIQYASTVKRSRFTFAMVLSLKARFDYTVINVYNFNKSKSQIIQLNTTGDSCRFSQTVNTLPVMDFT